MGVLKLHQFSEHEDKLKKIFERTVSLIEEYHPDELAIEAPFFGKNVQSMLKLGRAQGVAMAAGLSRTIPIFEYSPRKIKQSITGRGNASKEQVALMLQNLLQFRRLSTWMPPTDWQQPYATIFKIPERRKNSPAEKLHSLKIHNDKANKSKTQNSKLKLKTFLQTGYIFLN
jgi:Holliday junction resolvasome RuvABC endonuclease subunit